MNTPAPSGLLVPASPPPLVLPNFGNNVGGYIEKYIQLRFKKKQIKDRHTEELKPINDMLDMMEGGFLKHFQETNSDNASKAGVGTVYVKTTRSASVADPAEFRRFIIGGEHWELADFRANAPAIQTFIEGEGAGAIPPGVNFRTQQEVAVRKAS